MKRRWMLAGSLAAVALGVVLAQGTYAFLVNNKNVKLETVEKGGKVFVEVNGFAQALGAKVVFDKAKRAYTITSGGQPNAATTNPAQGTQQLAGGFGEIGKGYTIGKDAPLNFTLRSAEFTLTRQTMREVYAPKANEKLLLLRFTVQNPNKFDVGINYAAFKITAVDDGDRNAEFDCYWARDGQTDELNTALKPAQKVDVVAVWPVAANAKIPKLIVQRGDGTPVVRYDLGGKIKGLAAPFADAKDPTGSTALEVVTAQAGTYYPMAALDVKLEGTAYSGEQMDGRKPEAGKRFLIATFAVKNGTGNRSVNYSYSNFSIDLTNNEGDTVKFNGYIIKPARDEQANGDLKPGAETRFRAYFELPEGVTGKALAIAENFNGLSRQYVFDVSGAK